MSSSGVPVLHWNFGIGPITCHAWNKDRSQIAVSASSNEIHIFEWRNGDWQSIHTLSEHDLPVTGLDWGTRTNRIVSCSQDKNAFVWTFDKNIWKPELVLVRFNRAATYVKWSPLENKFAVGSGAKLVSVCYYEQENHWWVSKQIKKPIRSTVTCLDWHPNNVLLAVGSCDFKCRVFSAYVKEVDEKPSPNPWGQKMPFGQLMSEYYVGGWVHRVAFSPSGCRLAFVSHDSSVSFVDSNLDSQKVQNLRTIHLPFTTVEWITENSVVTAGHDCSPVLFVVQQDVLKEVCKLDVPSAAKSSTVNSALQLFKNIDRNNAAEKVNVALKTLHQNRITSVNCIRSLINLKVSDKFFHTLELLVMCQSLRHAEPMGLLLSGI
ncbi:CBN-ARX-3 protein [Caenorhabditis brenneri]|uniref:Actin-related protein 2/3 complex subunit n=1 Tax=Caenorhabditis brenneri TaxID=135651 RepID=G0NRJ4_CAEBE|nr:CBN-ARX-3 protein [Caenorhabditis brenneri]